MPSRGGEKPRMRITPKSPPQAGTLVAPLQFCERALRHFLPSEQKTLTSILSPANNRMAHQIATFLIFKDNIFIFIYNKKRHNKSKKLTI